MDCSRLAGANDRHQNSLYQYPVPRLIALGFIPRDYNKANLLFGMIVVGSDVGM